MNMFGWGGGDIIALSRLVVEKYKAYKDAPDDYRHISDEVNSLQIIINKAVRHFESTTLSNNSRQEGQEILKGCQNVLEDLNSLIEKYDSLACANTGQVLQRIKLSSEDITTLRLRLISNTTLLNGFIQRFDVPNNYQLAYYTNISTSAVNRVRYMRGAHRYLILFVFSAQTQEFHWTPLLLLLPEASIQGRVTRSSAKFFTKPELHQTG